MENSTLIIKLKQRLNKLDSQDFDNIETWQFIEAFIKCQVEWCRRNLHGGNMYKEGDELSKKRIDDLQPFLIVEADSHYHKKVNLLSPSHCFQLAHNFRPCCQ